MDSVHSKMLDLGFPHYEKEEFTMKHKIGSGACGTVFSGQIKLLDDSIDCIIKQVQSDNYNDDSKDMLYTDFLDEVTIGSKFMSKSKHQIQFYGYSHKRSKQNDIIYLLMEKTSATSDLSGYISQDKFCKALSKQEYNRSQSHTKMYHEDKFWDYIMKPDSKLEIIKQLVLAVKDLHSFQVVHCDLKPHNMLYTNNRIKLIDYNASQYLGDNKEIEGPAELGTPGYMSPELCDGWISYKSDIYSIGVCMLEIWFGDIWPSESSNYSKCRKYVLDYLSLLKQDHPTLHKLVKRCLSTESTKRPSIKKILSSLGHIREADHNLGADHNLEADNSQETVG